MSRLAFVQPELILIELCDLADKLSGARTKEGGTSHNAGKKFDFELPQHYAGTSLPSRVEATRKTWGQTCCVGFSSILFRHLRSGWYSVFMMDS